MKKLTSLFLFILLAVVADAQKAKYVFFFIGDGMGVNQVNTTEMYLAELENRIGISSLLFTSFPVTTMATTYSATNSVTDSSAGGTALACGEKTYNGAIGVDKERNAIQSVAAKAKKAGRKVAILTSVSVDHATPAAFYAHQPDRNMYYEIATDLPKAGFDFYGGSGFLRPNKEGQPNVFTLFDEAGYTVVRGLNEYDRTAAKADKMILIQEEGKSASALPYAIDRKNGEMSVADITGKAIDFMMKGKDKGFFMMIEGGKIDWACHSNDPATVVNEVIDMDQAVKVAYEFYKKHPKETLIVISADHETGGIGMGTGRYELNLKALAQQKQSVDELSRSITDLRKAKNNNVAWEDVKTLLSEKMGFWTTIPLSWEQEKALFNEYGESIVKDSKKFEETLYSRTEPLATMAKRIMSQIAMLGWTTGGHSAGYVPVYAIGVGAEAFGGKIENMQIPLLIGKIGGYK